MRLQPACGGLYESSVVGWMRGKGKREGEGQGEEDVEAMWGGSQDVERE